jgi:hypothetical protein
MADPQLQSGAPVMSGKLTERDRRVLVGLLERLASPSAGERDNAAVKAVRLIKAAGMQWDNVLVAGVDPDKLNPKLTSKDRELAYHYARWEVRDAELAWLSDFERRVIEDARALRGLERKSDFDLVKSLADRVERRRLKERADAASARSKAQWAARRARAAAVGATQ